MVHVNGAGTGGTTTLSAGNALRMDGPLRELGIDLDREFEELAREVPREHAPTGASWSEPTRRLFELCEEPGLAPAPHAQDDRLRPLPPLRPLRPGLPERRQMGQPPLPRRRAGQRARGW